MRLEETGRQPENILQKILKSKNYNFLELYPLYLKKLFLKSLKKTGQKKL